MISNSKCWATGALAACLLAAGTGTARASDPWEGGVLGGDDGSFSRNTIGHGGVQNHDLDEAGGGNDVDWVIVPTVQRHSYEARVTNTAASFDWGACGSCAQFERVDASGATLTEDVSTVNEGNGSTEEGYDRSVRWIATASTVDEYVRVTGSVIPDTANDVYTLRYWDTTYTAPRWNSSGGQVTVFLISNVTQGTINGEIYFHNNAGTLLHTQPFVLSGGQLYSLNTGTIPALAGLAGHAYVAHTAGYGGLSGKAVALEAATGFSFDTLMTHIPQ